MIASQGAGREAARKLHDECRAYGGWCSVVLDANTRGVKRGLGCGGLLFDCLSACSNSPSNSEHF